MKSGTESSSPRKPLTLLLETDLDAEISARLKEMDRPEMYEVLKRKLERQSREFLTRQVVGSERLTPLAQEWVMPDETIAEAAWRFLRDDVFTEENSDQWAEVVASLPFVPWWLRGPVRGVLDMLFPKRFLNLLARFLVRINVLPPWHDVR